MNIFSISYKNIKAKPLSSILNLVLFTTGIFIISSLLLIRTLVEEQFNKNLAGVDLVVGAKGSPLQLILSSLYHIDYPTGNISYAEAGQLKRHPLVKKTIPLALGDNYHGFRIVGTDHAYVELYQGILQRGDLWKQDFEVTIGGQVARETGLKIGDRFTGIHGFIAEGADKHDEFQYQVAGILERTGTVLDQLILTNVSSVWKIHSHHHHHEEETGEMLHHEEEVGETLHHDGEHDETLHHGEEHDPAGRSYYSGDLSKEDHHEEADTIKEITSLLVFYRNPMGAVTLPRMINKNTHMQAASPVVEINRLYSLLGISIDTVSLIALILILISGFSIFISLLGAMKERKYELALMRILGGGRIRLFSIVIIEGLLIAVSGYFLGMLFSRTGIMIISGYAGNNFHYEFNSTVNFRIDLYLFLASIGIGFLSALLPALKAMKTDISKTLAE
jgi:putative ABC transport system permease protein